MPDPKPLTDLNTLYRTYRSNPTKENEELLLKEVLRFIKPFVLSIGSAYERSRSSFTNLEDVITDSAVEVWQNLHRYDPRRSSFKTWVASIAKHNVRDTLRHYKAERGSRQHIMYIDESIPSYAPSALTHVILEEQLTKLASIDRSVVRLKMRGLSDSEIAEELELTNDAVSQRWRRSLKKLRK